MSIYKIDQKKSFNKKTDSIINKLPSSVQNYLISQTNKLEPSTRYGYASNYFIFFNFICDKITKFSHLLPVSMTLDDIRLISYSDVEFFTDYYSVDHSSAAINRILCSLSSFYNFYIKQYVLEVNPIIAVRRFVPKNKAFSITQEEVSIILDNVCNGNFLTGKSLKHHSRLKSRDYAILRLIIDLGLTVSDLCGLNIRDVDLKDNSLWLFSAKKGWSVLHFTDDLNQILSEYSNCRLTKNAIDEDAYFIQRDGKRISSRSIELIVKKYCSSSPELSSITPGKLRSFSIK